MSDTPAVADSRRALPHWQWHLQGGARLGPVQMRSFCASLPREEGYQSEILAQCKAYEREPVQLTNPPSLQACQNTKFCPGFECALMLKPKIFA